MLQLQKIKKPSRFSLGFSLIELLIVLAILSILLCLVYPNYTQHLVAVRRHNVAAVLVDLAGRMEQFYIRGNSYAGAKLDQLGTDDTSYQKYYQITIDAAADTYRLNAIPLAGQSQSDQACGTLSLDQEGKKSISGYSSLDSCWP